MAPWWPSFGIHDFGKKYITFRMLRASRWVTPLVDLPLIDKTRSPFWIRPSRSAKVPGITLWTWKNKDNIIKCFTQEFYSQRTLFRCSKGTLIIYILVPFNASKTCILTNSKLLGWKKSFIVLKLFFVTSLHCLKSYLTCFL